MGLDVLRVEDFLKKQTQNANFVSFPAFMSNSNVFPIFSASNEHLVMLWHFRLGHSSFLYLEKLFSSLFDNKTTKFFQCDIFQMTKHVHVSFPSLPYKTTHSFSIIQSDVWASSSVNKFFEARWLVSFKSC